MSVSATLVSLMVRLQRRVRRHPGLVQSIRTVRNLLHFGPWRRLALTYIRITSPPPDWLEKAWSGAKRRGIDKLTSQEIDTEIAAHRREKRK